MSNIDEINYTGRVKHTGPHACDAWRLLVGFSLSQRGNFPTVAAELDLSPAQCHVLHLVEPGRPVSMGQLADTLSCDASNVTGLVDRLESRGLVRREPSDSDRRVKVLALTPAGAKLRAVLVERMSAPPETLGRLSAEEQRALVRILRRLLE
jgi:DNA-binding MarR family transcriptional regulator